jgi:hypothetical protein
MMIKRVDSQRRGLYTANYESPYIIQHKAMQIAAAGIAAKSKVSLFGENLN